jgi:hypothetical protein
MHNNGFRHRVLFLLTVSISTAICLLSLLNANLVSANVTSLANKTEILQKPQSMLTTGDLSLLPAGIQIVNEGINKTGGNLTDGLPDSKVDPETVSDNALLASIFATDLSNRLNQSASLLEITAELPQVRNTPFANLLNQTLGTLHGVPQHIDTEKRMLAKNILYSKDSDLFEVFYLMPNGDMYMIEPYSTQETLTANNYAFRDYFQGTVRYNDTYLGNAITTTAASGVREAVMTVPVFSLDDNATLAGVWAGGIDFGRINQELQAFKLDERNKRVVYVDSNGEKISDSDPLLSSKFESFGKLNSFKNAVRGDAGYGIETANGKKTIITYHPVNAFHNTWAVLVIEPFVSP